jgi:O-antigen/teichoic acid export membrane protein
MSLGQKVVSAIGWSASIKVGFQLITWAMTLLVIRILSPDDYGLMAIAQVFINIMSGLSDLGLGDALVQQEDTPKPVIASAFGLILVVSAVLTVLLCFAAYPIAAWYHDPRLVLLIQVASLGFLLNGLMVLPRTYLTKSLRIRPMFVMELSSGLVGSVVVIVLAYAGYGAWALLLGALLSNIVRLACFSVLTAEYYVWPSMNLKLVRPLCSYGAFRTLDYLAWVAFTSADTLILGRWLGPADLGVYTVALNFAGMPLSKIAPVINSVAFPAFALMQRRQAEARYYALKATRLMATVSVPVFFGISAVAPEIVRLVFGPKWSEAQPILAVLSLAMPLRAILLVIPNYLQGIGEARAGFYGTVTGAVLFPPAFLIGCHWGVVGVCYAWLLGYFVMYAINALIAYRYGQLDVRQLLMAPLRPLVAGIVMLAVLMTLRSTLSNVQSDILRLMIMVSVGAATYGLVMILAFRPLAVEIVSLLLAGRRKVA